MSGVPGAETQLPRCCGSTHAARFVPDSSMTLSYRELLESGGPLVEGGSVTGREERRDLHLFFVCKIVFTIPYVTFMPTVRHRGMETGISEASKRVSIFSFATQGGKQVSFHF
jgi:hypothetical protein